VRLDEAQLQAGFAQFVAAARELERGYAELKARAAQVDLELQATNQALQVALAERETVFAAVPLGLVTVRGGQVCCRNTAGERLWAAAVAAGVDLRVQRGEVVCGSTSIRVQRVDLPDGELLVLEDRSAVQELERQVHRLDRLAGLSELALGIAHEIKNPLNGVMGFASLLERADDPATQRRYAARVKDGVRQVDEIVRAMLGFARADRQGGRDATVATIAAEAAQAAGLPAARLLLEGELARCADHDVLVRVLANLFRNAIEARPDVHVRVRAGVRAGRLELDVQDDGPGVARALGQRAFEPFVSTKERGTGLGLPLSVRVLAYLGGELELQNPGEPGARFLIRLPQVAGAVAGTAAGTEVTA
jgi:signal transduction histidine kinase